MTDGILRHSVRGFGGSSPGSRLQKIVSERSTSLSANVQLQLADGKWEGCCDVGRLYSRYVVPSTITDMTGNQAFFHKENIHQIRNSKIGS